MEYAVIKTGGKQYKVSKGSVLDVDRLPFEKNKEILIPHVLLFVSDAKVKVGKPILSDVKVKARILDIFKGEKIRVGKFKAKARHRRVMGFRPSLSRLSIKDVVLENKSPKSSGRAMPNKINKTLASRTKAIR